VVKSGVARDEILQPAFFTLACPEPGVAIDPASGIERLHDHFGAQPPLTQVEHQLIESLEVSRVEAVVIGRLARASPDPEFGESWVVREHRLKPEMAEALRRPALEVGQPLSLAIESQKRVARVSRVKKRHSIGVSER